MTKLTPKQLEEYAEKTRKNLLHDIHAVREYERQHKIEPTMEQGLCGKGFIPIGNVSVDTAQIMIGDPMYAHEVVEKGLDAGGVVIIPSGKGDGSYPVYVRYEDVPGWGPRVMEALIVFIEDPTLEQEYNELLARPEMLQVAADDTLTGVIGDLADVFTRQLLEKYPPETVYAIMGGEIDDPDGHMAYEITREAVEYYIEETWRQGMTYREWAEAAGKEVCLHEEELGALHETRD